MCHYSLLSTKSPSQSTEQCVKICINLLLSSKNTHIWNELAKEEDYFCKCISRHTKRATKGSKRKHWRINLQMKKIFVKWEKKQHTWHRLNPSCRWMACLHPPTQQSQADKSMDQTWKMTNFFYIIIWTSLWEGYAYLLLVKEWKAELAWKTFIFLH